jgi:hypothetical protein
MWGRHIDWMNENHPEYKGEDFLNDKNENEQNDYRAGGECD